MPLIELARYICPICFTEYPPGVEYCPKCSSKNPRPQPVLRAYEAHEPHVDSWLMIEATTSHVKEQIKKFLEKVKAIEEELATTSATHS